MPSVPVASDPDAVLLAEPVIVDVLMVLILLLLLVSPFVLLPEFPVAPPASPEPLEPTGFVGGMPSVPVASEPEDVALEEPVTVDVLISLLCACGSGQ
jgi:hypothetical protein